MDCTVMATDAAMIESSLKMLTDRQLELALEASIRCLDAWREVNDIPPVRQRIGSL
jgi:hypothetical protein